MKILIIGSVAAGTSVAAKARRNTEDAEIVVYDREQVISYSVCGIPYAVGGEVETFSKLTPRDARWFKKRYNVDIHTAHEITEIDHENKQVRGIDLQTNKIFTDNYDVLVFATGSRYYTPELFRGRSYANVFQVKTVASGEVIQQYINNQSVKNALIVGAGYIGLEMAEQLQRQGIKVTIMQRSAHPMSHLDADMASRIESSIQKHGIVFYPNETITEIIGEPVIEQVKTSKQKIVSTDMVILATGVRSNTKLAESIGVQVGKTGAIAVNEYLETNIKDVYAVGDVAESFDLITKRALYRPLASTANKMGRIVGDHITGGNLNYRGSLGTGILRFFDLTIAQTGLTQQEAKQAGIEVVALHNIKPNKPDYMDGKEMVIKALADKKTDRLIGAQIIGYEGVDKRIDVLATAISFGAKAEDLFHLDLAYAPPFSTTKDPVHYTGMALDNALRHHRLLISPEELVLMQQQQAIQIIDVRSPRDFEKSHVIGALHIPLAELRARSKELDPLIPTITYCNKGVSGNAAQNILINQGFERVYNLSGGNKNYQEYQTMFN